MRQYCVKEIVIDNLFSLSPFYISVRRIDKMWDQVKELQFQSVEAITYVSICESRWITEIGPYTVFNDRKLGKTIEWSPPKLTIRGCSQEFPSEARWYGTCLYHCSICLKACAASKGMTGISPHSILVAISESDFAYLGLRNSAYDLQSLTIWIHPMNTIVAATFLLPGGSCSDTSWAESDSWAIWGGGIIGKPSKALSRGCSSIRICSIRTASSMYLVMWGCKASLPIRDGQMWWVERTEDRTRGLLV